MSSEDEFTALRRQLDNGSLDNWILSMERRIDKESPLEREIVVWLAAAIQDATMLGEEVLTLCYLDPEPDVEEVILFIEGWLEKHGFVFHHDWWCKGGHHYVEITILIWDD